MHNDNRIQILSRHFCSDMVAELPFILMHPKPEEEDPIIGDRSPRRSSSIATDAVHKDGQLHEVPTTNLIQLDG